MAALDRQGMTSYERSVVTLSLGGTVAELKAVEVDRKRNRKLSDAAITRIWVLLV